MLLNTQVGKLCIIVEVRVSNEVMRLIADNICISVKHPLQIFRRFLVFPLNLLVGPDVDVLEVQAVLHLPLQTVIFIHPMLFSIAEDCLYDLRLQWNTITQIQDADSRTGICTVIVSALLDRIGKEYVHDKSCLACPCSGINCNASEFPVSVIVFDHTGYIPFLHRCHTSF